MLPKPLNGPADFVLTAGNPDGFLKPVDVAPPGACNINAWPSYVPWKGYDSKKENRHVGHRFTPLPAGMVKAELELHMKPTDDDFSFNDTVRVGLPANCPAWPNAPYTWFGSIAALPGAGGTWNNGQNGPTTFVLDLGVLSPAVLAQMNSTLRLDVVVEDDTTVDYMKLRVWTCAPIPRCDYCDIPLEAAAVGTNIVVSWPVAPGITNLHLEATESLGSANWSPVNAPVQEMGGRRSVTLPMSGSSRFFRLSDQIVTPCGWSVCDTNSPLAARYENAAAWADDEWILWGGFNGVTLFNDGAIYTPATRTWRPMSTNGTPSARYRMASAWTGKELIVWSGLGVGGFLNTGGRYNPDTDTWTPLTTGGAPTARNYGTMVYAKTTHEVIVWGGRDGSGNANTGGRYSLSNNTWAALPIPTLAARLYHAAEWADSTGEMLIWGGFDASSTAYGDGARYNPTNNTWRPISTNGAPAARYQFPWVWTGTEMIVWGAGPGVGNTGGRYNPSTDLWTTTTTNGAPPSHSQGAAVWTGSEMFAWGGWNGNISYNDGGCYDPVANTWTLLPTIGAAPGRFWPSIAFDGDEVLIWGGRSGSSVTGTLAPHVWCFRKCP